MSLAQLVAAPISTLASRFPVEKLDELAAALDLGSIHDLAAWPPYQAARDLLDRVYSPTLSNGSRAGDLVDPGTPPDLLPATGQYPTERVQYEVLLFDSFVEDGPAQPARSLVKAGQLDVSKLGSSPEGFTVPAIGGIVTYTQSWYTKGLSLGHLIHGVALGPGETTRIAVIDWARRVSTTAAESIEELELLVEELSRSRSIGEITSAVARETQKGRSAAQSASSAMQYGEARSGANLRDWDLFSSLQNMFGLAVTSPGVQTSGSSLGIASDASGAASWSTTTGRRDVGASLAQDIVDRTHQEAHSARNRRASIVREVSQAESETVSTRTLTNYNHMHALTIEYYEVVQLYRTVVELTKADRCVFVPLKPFDFRDMNVIDRYRAVLAAAALSPVMREALELPAATIPLRAPAVLSAELQAGDLTPETASTLAPDRWLARDISAAFAATGGQIRVLADGRLALPSEAVLIDAELHTTMPGSADAGASTDAFFVGSKIVSVTGSDETRTGLRLQKGSHVHLTAAGRVTFGSDVEPDQELARGIQPTQTVDSNEILNTGLRIEKGSRVDVKASGAINFHSYEGDTKSWNPDGQGGRAGQGFYAEDLRPASLVCRIAPAPQYYQGGIHETFVAQSTGELILQPNDMVGGMGNNTGAWRVDLEITPPAGAPTTNVFDADGMPGATGSEFTAPARKRYSLICRVGTAWEQGGTVADFDVHEDGELVMQPNDLVEDLHNNSGSWQVTLTVTPPGPDTTAAAPEPVLTATKRKGGAVKIARKPDGEWPVGAAALLLDDIDTVSVTAPGARPGDVGYLALTFRYRSSEFRIVFPVRLPGAGAATVFHADARADLVSHLLDQRLYYSQVIWSSLDPATIGMLLSGYTWRLDGQSRRLVEIVDPTPVAVVANYLAFRLSSDDADERAQWLERAQIKVGLTREDQVPIPTGGVFAEAVLGRSNSAEKLDVTRFWDWQESPIPIEAPEIAAVQTGSRGEPDLTVPGHPGQPVLNIVNPPGLPDPQGMAAILAAIQNGSMFRDMSGLAGTIGLAQAGMQDAGRAASQAAEQAGVNAATAAQLGAKVAEIAGQIISAYLTKGGSLLGGGGGGQGLIEKAGGNSKSGQMLNYAREFDQRTGGARQARENAADGASADGASPAGSANGAGAAEGASPDDGGRMPFAESASMEGRTLAATIGSSVFSTSSGSIPGLLAKGVKQLGLKLGEKVVDQVASQLQSGSVNVTGVAKAHALLAGYEDRSQYFSSGPKQRMTVQFANLGAVEVRGFVADGLEGGLEVTWTPVQIDPLKLSRQIPSAVRREMANAVCLADIAVKSPRGMTIGQALTKATVSSRIEESNQDPRVIEVGGESQSFLEANLVVSIALDPVSIAGFPVGTDPIVADVDILIRPAEKIIRENPGGATAFVVTEVHRPSPG